jgi:hypothetical protein
MEQEAVVVAPADTSGEAAEVSASESTATAAVENEEGQPPVDEQKDAPKTFTQEEVDALIARRLAREQRKLDRERQQQVAAPAPETTLKPEQFESTEAYVEALAEQKAEERIRRREAEQQAASIHESYLEREDKARDRYDDYEQVVYNPNLKITTTMAETIRRSEIGPEVAYHLGQNPREADRISRLDSLSQAKEIGKLEAKLVAAPPVKKTTSAPAPINPVTPRNSGASAVDTTDPRSTKTMTTSEWIAAENARELKRLQGNR